MASLEEAGASPQLWPQLAQEGVRKATLTKGRKEPFQNHPAPTHKQMPGPAEAGLTGAKAVVLKSCPRCSCPAARPTDTG